MKKLIITLSFIMVAIAMMGQTRVIQIAKGAKDVDSVSGAQTKYYYLKVGGTFTTASAVPIYDYYVYAIQATTTRATVLTGDDSCHITFEVSADNTNWHKFTGTTPKVSGGAVYLITDDLVTTTTNGSCVFQPTTCYYPYIRVKFQHYVASTTMYPTAWVIIKKY
jgi:hypothetical protein